MKNIPAIPKTRPKFKKPPVIEVAATLNFEEIDPKQLATLIGQLWDKVGRECYTSLDFKNDMPDKPGLHFELEQIDNTSKFRFPRYWFESHDKSDLIQVSHKKIAFHWRKILQNDDNQYKSFEHVWEKFEKAINALQELISSFDKKLQIKPTGMELGYFNYIKLNDFGGSLSQIDSIYPSHKWLNNAKWLGEPNAFNFLWNVPDIKNHRNTFIQSQTAIELASGEPIIQLNIITRSQPTDSIVSIGENKFKEWFDDSHNLIINTFTSLTSKEAQSNYWEREDETE